MTEARRPLSTTLLLALVAFTGVTAIIGGIALVADPGGGALHLSPGMLHRGPFRDFGVPGLFLVVVLGVGALPIGVGLRARKRWAAGAALAYGVVLLAWLTIQAGTIGILSPLQPVYGTIGLLIVAFALSVRSR